MESVSCFLTSYVAAMGFTGLKTEASFPLWLFAYLSLDSKPDTIPVDTNPSFVDFMFLSFGLEVGGPSASYILYGPRGVSSSMLGLVP